MSAAAGAPPPSPPPPPPPKGSFNSLPAELLLEIIRYLQINDYIQFALAIYSVLQQHRLAPPLTIDIYNRITRPRPAACKTATCGGGGKSSEKHDERHGPVRLPVELNDQIMNHLEPADRLAWLFSDQGMFSVYFPELSQETQRQLREALRNVQRDAQRSKQEKAEKK